MPENILDLLQQAETALLRVDKQLERMPADLEKRFKTIFSGIRRRELKVLRLLLKAAIELGWEGEGEGWCFQKGWDHRREHDCSSINLLSPSGHAIEANNAKKVIGKPESFQDLTITLINMLKDATGNLETIDQLDGFVKGLDKSSN